MTLSEDLAWRGLIKDKTFDDIGWINNPQTFYHGVDVTSDSLTIGNLAALLLARRLIDANWKAVLLVGGATSLVGDPGGKSEERELIEREDIKHNIESIKAQINQLFAGRVFTPVDNYQWWNRSETHDGVQYLDFLREYGKRFSMTELMQREFVTERMGKGGSGISYAEFSYGLIQAYDFFRLNQKKGHKDGQDVVLQIGGSDQWSNMLLGVSLIRKKTAKDAHALSMPLVVNKETGTKFGKSEAGAIWLDASKTSTFKFYQFWINTSDEDAEDYLKIFTMLAREEIENLIKDQRAHPSSRPAQKKLGYELTELVHGSDQATRQQRIAEAVAGEIEIKQLEQSELAIMREEMPYQKIQPGASVIDVLKETNLAASNSEARRLLESKAVYANGQPFTKPHFESSDFKNDRLMLRRGKAYKDSALIELA
jgi:tyrosyl-tRNA synthetase